MNSTITLTDPVTAERISSGWDFPLDTPADEIVEWAERQLVAGAEAAQADVAAKLGSPVTDLAAADEPFAFGYLSAIEAGLGRPKRTHDILAALGDFASQCPVMRCESDQEVIDRQLDLHSRRCAAREEADGLIEASAAASMKPASLPHYDSEELQTAMAVVEQYGRFNEQGGFATLRVHTLDEEARRLLAIQPDRDYDTHYQWVKERWFELTSEAAQRVIKGGRIRLDFQYRPRGEWAEPGTEQLVFVSMPTSSRAYQRGEKVWVLSYCAPVFIGRDGKLAEAFRQPGIRRPEAEEGLMGCVATFGSLHEAMDAAQDLSRAIGTIRRAGVDPAELEQPREGFRRTTPTEYGALDSPF